MRNSRSSKIGRMKTVVGVGYCLNVRVVNIVCDKQRRQKQSAEPLPAQKTTKRHDKPLGATEKPPRTTYRKKKKKRPAYRYWPGPRQRTETRLARRSQLERARGSSSGARVIGFGGDVVWLQHGAVPVAPAVYLWRPSTTAELLTRQVLDQNVRPAVQTTQRSEEQPGFIDAQEPTTTSQGPQQRASTTVRVSPDSTDNVENDDSQPELESAELPQFAHRSLVGFSQTARVTQPNREVCASRWCAQSGR